MLHMAPDRASLAEAEVLKLCLAKTDCVVAVQRYEAEALRHEGEEEAPSDDDDGVGILMQGWVVRSRRRPILSDHDREALAHRLASYWAARGKTSIVAHHGDEGGEGPSPSPPDHVSGNTTPEQHHLFTPLPEILFGHSFLELHHQTSGISLRFNTVGALARWAHKHVTPSLEVLKVPEASHWAESLEGTKLKEVRYDWVFGTDYEGELMGPWGREKAGGDVCGTVLDGDDESVARSREEVGSWEPAEADCFDRDMLRSRDPILFYDDITLYEDELHDHGVVQLNVKIRVMPKCWFVLLRYWLRVDGMIMRVRDTRYFHAFGSSRVGREVSSVEVTVASLQSKGLPTEPYHYQDPNRVATMFGPPAATYATLTIPPPGPS